MSKNTMNGNDGESNGALAGYRVLDFGWVLAGAIPGMVLADMGAEVIKVETRQRLDYMRMGRPIVGDQPDPEQNPMFHNVNRGKLSVTLNIGEPDAVELAKRLVASCDVVIENYSPGVMNRLGLGYETLRDIKPDIIMASISSTGQEGPLRDLRAMIHDLGMTALVEAHDEWEVEAALEAGAGLVGVNNRDLAVFETDLAVTERLARYVPGDVSLVSESGIRGRDDVVRVAAAGADAVLVGEALVRSGSPGGLVAEMAAVKRVGRG